MRRSTLLSCSLGLGFLVTGVTFTASGCGADDPVAPGVAEGGTVEGGGGGDDANVPSTCTPPTGAGTTHDTSPAADETWTAAGSPHVVTAILSIAAGRTLTIEPCAVVQLKPAGGLLVSGKVSAIGAADKRITFERSDASKAWTSIETRKGAEVRLAYTTIEGGGNSNGGRPGQFGMLDIRGDQDIAPQPILFVDHVTVKGSESLGIWAREGGGFASGSQDLTITGGATFPMTIWGRASGGIPTGSYTGNATDEIFLPANGVLDDIREDTTLAARGVPYRVGGDLGGKMMRVQSTSGTPLLTIEPGVTMRFAKGVALVVESATTTGPASGALKAAMTSSPQRSISTSVSARLGIQPPGNTCWRMKSSVS